MSKKGKNPSYLSRLLESARLGALKPEVRKAQRETFGEIFADMRAGIAASLRKSPEELARQRSERIARAQARTAQKNLPHTQPSTQAQRISVPRRRQQASPKTPSQGVQHQLSNFNFGEEIPNERPIGFVGGKEGTAESLRGRYKVGTYRSGGAFSKPNGQPKYPTNEDSVLAMPSEGLIATADGMGGGESRRGNDASKATIDTIMRNPTALIEDIVTEAAYNMSQERLTNRNDGATLAIIRPDANNPTNHLEAINIGDAKCYIFSQTQNGEWFIKFKSRDQSRLEEYRKQGYSEVEIRNSNDANVITNCICYKGAHEANRTYNIPRKRGDIAMTMSDGIADVLSGEDILELIKKHGYRLNPQTIIDEAFKRQEQAYAKTGFQMRLNGRMETITQRYCDNTGIAMMIC